MEVVKLMELIVIMYVLFISILVGMFILKTNKDINNSNNDNLTDDIKAIRKLLHKLYFCEKINLQKNFGINIDEFYDVYQAKLAEKILEDIDTTELEEDDEEENKEYEDDAE